MFNFALVLISLDSPPDELPPLSSSSEDIDLNPSETGARDPPLPELVQLRAGDVEQEEEMLPPCQL